MHESMIYQDILQEGLEQKAQEIAIKMINKGIHIETIAIFRSQKSNATLT